MVGPQTSNPSGGRPILIDVATRDHLEGWGLVGALSQRIWEPWPSTWRWRLRAAQGQLRSYESETRRKPARKQVGQLFWRIREIA